MVNRVTATPDALSLLKKLDPGNVKNLELKWILPDQVFGAPDQLRL